MSESPATRLSSTPRFPTDVTIFTIGYVLAAGIAALLLGNLEFLFYIIVLVTMAGAIGLVHSKLFLSSALLWLLSIWGLLHMSGGLVPVPDSWPIDGDIRVLYSWWIIPDDDAPGELGGWLKYDHVVHVYGYGVTAVLLWQVLRALIHKYTGAVLQPTAGIMVIVVAASCGFGALNEIVEFIATRFAETNVGGYFNTGIDLVCNMLGAIIAAVIVIMNYRRA